jgi:outer membrane protein
MSSNTLKKTLLRTKRKNQTMFKQILSISVLCLFSITLGISSVNAQETTIGYVDPQAILDKMPEMKAVQQRLENFVQRKQEELATKQQNFQNEIAEYQKKAAVISEEAKAEEEQRLGKLNAELRQYQMQIQQEIQQKRQELVGPLITNINSAISSVAQEMGLTYVLNMATSTGDIIILYASEEARAKYDITDQVMQELGI